MVSSVALDPSIGSMRVKRWFLRTLVVVVSCCSMVVTGCVYDAGEGNGSESKRPSDESKEEEGRAPAQEPPMPEDSTEPLAGPGEGSSTGGVDSGSDAAPPSEAVDPDPPLDQSAPDDSTTVGSSEGTADRPLPTEEEPAEGVEMQPVSFEGDPEVAERVEGAVGDCEMSSDGTQWLCSMSSAGVLSDVESVLAVNCFVTPAEDRFDCFPGEVVRTSTVDGSITWAFETVSGLRSTLPNTCRFDDINGWYCDSQGSCDFDEASNQWWCEDEVHVCSLDREDRRWSCAARQPVPGTGEPRGVFACYLSEQEPLFVCPVPDSP